MGAVDRRRQRAHEARRASPSQAAAATAVVVETIALEALGVAHDEELQAWRFRLAVRVLGGSP